MVFVRQLVNVSGNVGSRGEDEVDWGGRVGVLESVRKYLWNQEARASGQITVRPSSSIDRLGQSVVSSIFVANGMRGDVRSGGCSLKEGGSYRAYTGVRHSMETCREHLPLVLTPSNKTGSRKGTQVEVIQIFAGFRRCVVYLSSRHVPSRPFPRNMRRTNIGLRNVIGAALDTLQKRAEKGFPQASGKTP